MNTLCFFANVVMDVEVMASIKHLRPTRNFELHLESLRVLCSFFKINLFLFFKLFLHKINCCILRFHQPNNFIGSVHGARQDNNGRTILLFNNFLLSNQSSI